MLGCPGFQFSLSSFRLATYLALRLLVACRDLFFQLRQFILQAMAVPRRFHFVLAQHIAHAVVLDFAKLFAE
jgi:hypothetical protein